MHGAPSVSHPVGRSRFAAVVSAAGWLLAAGGLALWSVQVQAAGPARFGAAFVLLAAGAFAAWSWLRSPQGTLAWDGEGWSWASAPPPEKGMPEPILDLQQVLLLRWRAETGAVRWLWAERRERPSTWDDLRRAVYSRVRP